jgi:hypothetical protein
MTMFEPAAFEPFCFWLICKLRIPWISHYLKRWIFIVGVTSEESNHIDCINRSPSINQLISLFLLNLIHASKTISNPSRSRSSDIRQCNCLCFLA